MGTLSAERCVACRRDSPRVTEAEIAELTREIPDWRRVERDGVARLERVFHFPSFADALAFTNRVGALAEVDGHHPALLTEWGQVTVTWWTHKIRALHRNDFIMAAKTDALLDVAGGEPGALRDLTLRFTEAFNRDDLDGVMAYFADDAVYDEFNGSRSHGKDAIRAALAPQFRGDYGTIRF